jgi:hypothetical protein
MPAQQCDHLLPGTFPGRGQAALMQVVASPWTSPMLQVAGQSVHRVQFVERPDFALDEDRASMSSAARRRPIRDVSGPVLDRG